MRQRSITGPLILVGIGILFLLNNLRPEFSPFAMIGEYWPFLLIGAGIIGLVEVLIAVGRGASSPPCPIGGGWIFWIVMWSLVAAFFSHHTSIRLQPNDWNGISFLGSDYDYDAGVTGIPSTLPPGVTRVVLQNLRGNVSLRGEETPAVKITGHKTVRAWNRPNADRADHDSGVVVETRGDSLVVRMAQDDLIDRATVSTDLDISVPKQLNVEARGRTGDLLIENMDGSLNITTARGDVRLNHIGKDVRIDAARSSMVRASNVKGNVELVGRGRDVQLEDITGASTISGDFSGTLEFRALTQGLKFASSKTEFHVEAVPGEITLDLSDLKLTNVAGPVKFRTGSRDVEVHDVTNGLDVSVDRGDIHVTQSKAPLPRMDLHSRNGDIAVAIPDQAGFHLHGSTSRGEAENEFGAPLSTQSSGRGATIQGQASTGPEITLTTERGTISVRKL